MSSVSVVPPLSRISEPATPALKEAARDFEALVFQQLLKQAAKPLGKGGPFDRGPGAQLYRQLLFEELAGVAGRAGSLGIGKLLEEQAAASEGEAERDER